MKKEIEAGLGLSNEVLWTTDERYGNAPERQIWQAHVEKEERKRTVSGLGITPSIHHWAEEYSQRAMRGVDASENEYQMAEQRGEKHGIGNVRDELANAGDIAGG